MADTLVTFQQAMNLLPDNASRLIEPDDVRSAFLSLLPDRGAAFAVGTFTVPIVTQGTWVDIPIGIGGGATMVQGDALFWRKDSNGHLVYDYQADWPAATVPPGYVREVFLVGVVQIDPGNIVWEFAFTIGGVIQAPTVLVDSASTTDSISVPIISGDPVDVSAAPPVSLSVRNLTNTDDLPLTLVSFRATGGVQA
jgi:hypothetical protein